MSWSRNRDRIVKGMDIWGKSSRKMMIVDRETK
jgi:hypothetical protein